MATPTVTHNMITRYEMSEGAGTDKTNVSGILGFFDILNILSQLRDALEVSQDPVIMPSWPIKTRGSWNCGVFQQQIV